MPPCWYSPHRKTPVPRDKDIVKNDVRIGKTPTEVPLKVLPLSHIVGVNHLFHAFMVSRHGKADRIVYLFPGQCPGRYNQNFVCNGPQGNVHLAPSHHNAVALFFHKVEVCVRIRLAGRALHSLTFDVSLCATTHKVVFESIRATLKNSDNTLFARCLLCPPHTRQRSMH